MSSNPLIRQDIAKRTFQNAMNRYVGAGKDYSVKELSAATGVDIRTINSYRSGETTPSIEKLQSIGEVLGTEFLNAAFAHTSFSFTFDQPNEITTPSVISELATVTAHIAKAHEDLHLDHREIADLLKVVPGAIDSLMAFMAKLENRRLREVG